MEARAGSRFPVLAKAREIAERTIFDVEGAEPVKVQQGELFGVE